MTISKGWDELLSSNDGWYFDGVRIRCARKGTSSKASMVMNIYESTAVVCGVSSEGSDLFRIKDSTGAVISTISGAVDNHVVSLDSALSPFTFEYQKDGSRDTGLDYAWVTKLEVDDQLTDHHAPSSLSMNSTHGQFFASKSGIKGRGTASFNIYRDYTTRFVMGASATNVIHLLDKNGVLLHAVTGLTQNDFIDLKVADSPITITTISGGDVLLRTFEDANMLSSSVLVPYIVSGNWAYDGTRLCSPTLGNGKASSMVLDIKQTTAVLCNVSSEHCDYLTVTDSSNTQLLHISLGVYERTIILDPEQSPFTFTYRTDGSALSGQNRAWISDCYMFGKFDGNALLLTQEDLQYFSFFCFPPTAKNLLTTEFNAGISNATGNPVYINIGTKLRKGELRTLVNEELSIVINVELSNDGVLTLFENDEIIQSVNCDLDSVFFGELNGQLFIVDEHESLVLKSILFIYQKVYLTLLLLDGGVLDQTMTALDNALENVKCNPNVFDVSKPAILISKYGVGDKDRPFELGYYQSSVLIQGLPAVGRKVMCFTQYGELLDETLSDKNGIYRFDMLPINQKYLFVAQDLRAGKNTPPEYQAVAASFQSATPYPLN